MRIALCSGVLTTESWHGPTSCWELGVKGVRRQRTSRLSKGFEPPVFLTSQFFPELACVCPLYDNPLVTKHTSSARLACF